MTKKIRKAECVPKEVEGNGVLALVEYVLLPASGLRTGTREFKVERRDAEPLVYSDINKVHEDYRNDVVCFFFQSEDCELGFANTFKLTPQTLKAAVTEGILALMNPIQADYQASKEWQEVTLKAYPPPVKKEKKVKNLGTRFPGAKGGKGGDAAEVTKKAEDLTIKDVQEQSPANPTA